MYVLEASTGKSRNSTRRAILTATAFALIFIVAALVGLPVFA